MPGWGQVDDVKENAREDKENRETMKKGNFRREVNVQVDYETARFGRFHLSPMLGLRYQNYYATHKFWIVNAGVALRFD